jgi:hypothetical protein
MKERQMVTEDDIFIAHGQPPVSDGFQTQSSIIMTGVKANGRICGVMGQSATSLLDTDKLPVSRIGVFGRGDNVGVYGVTDNGGPNSGFRDGFPIAGVVGTSDSHPGVFATSDGTFGVWAQTGDAAAQQMERAAMFATSSRSVALAAVSDTAVAVHAHSGPSHNFGTFRTGTVTATSSNNGIGVSAQSLKSEGVRGVSVGSRGVAGYSSASYGVYGLSTAPPAPNTTPPQVPAGVYGQSFGGGFGVLGVAARTGAGVTGTGSGDGIGVLGYHPNGAAGYFDGNLFVTGQIFAGIKDAIVPFPDGSNRLLHCMESPEHWFEDFGSARLKRGRATVKLDADFAKVVMLDDYRVFLTPEGDCKGLYVRSKRGASFEVRELQGGTSSIAFSYRIVAKRKDIKRHARFAKIDMPVAKPVVGKAPAARGRKAAPRPSPIAALLATLKKDVRKKAT